MVFATTGRFAVRDTRALMLPARSPSQAARGARVEPRFGVAEIRRYEQQASLVRSGSSALRRQCAARAVPAAGVPLQTSGARIARLNSPMPAHMTKDQGGTPPNGAPG